MNNKIILNFTLFSHTFNVKSNKNFTHAVIRIMDLLFDPHSLSKLNMLLSFSRNSVTPTSKLPTISDCERRSKMKFNVFSPGVL